MYVGVVYSVCGHLEPRLKSGIVCSYFAVEELQSEFFRDIEVATLVDPERSRKSTSDSSSVTSRDS